MADLGLGFYKAGKEPLAIRKPSSSLGSTGLERNPRSYGAQRAHTLGQGGAEPLLKSSYFGREEEVARGLYWPGPAPSKP